MKKWPPTRAGQNYCEVGSFVTNVLMAVGGLWPNSPVGLGFALGRLMFALVKPGLAHVRPGLPLVEDYSGLVEPE